MRLRRAPRTLPYRSRWNAECTSCYRLMCTARWSTRRLQTLRLFTQFSGTPERPALTPCRSIIFGKAATLLTMRNHIALTRQYVGHRWQKHSRIFILVVRTRRSLSISSPLAGTCNFSRTSCQRLKPCERGIASLLFPTSTTTCCNQFHSNSISCAQPKGQRVTSPTEHYFDTCLSSRDCMSTKSFSPASLNSMTLSEPNRWD